MPWAINCSRWAQDSTSWLKHQPLLSLQVMLDLGLLPLGAWEERALEKPWGFRPGFCVMKCGWEEGRRESTKGAGRKPDTGCFVGNG